MASEKPTNIKDSKATIEEVMRTSKIAQADLDKNYNAVMVMLKAVDKGMLTSAQQIKKALELASSSKFNDQTIASFAAQLDIEVKYAEELDRYWGKVRSWSKDQLKASTDFSSIYKQHGDLVDKLFNIQIDIGKQQTKNFNTTKQTLDISSQLVDKMQEFTDNLSKGPSPFKNINVDLTSSLQSLDKLAAESLKLGDLFDPSPFDWGDLEPQIKAADQLIHALENGLSNITMPEIGEIDTSSAITVIKDAHDLALKMINDESATRVKKLREYVAMQMGFQADFQTQNITDLTTQTKLSGDLAKIKLDDIRNRADELDKLSSQLTQLDSLNQSEINTLNKKIASYDDITKHLLVQNMQAKNIEATHMATLKTQQAQVAVGASVKKQMESLQDITYAVQEGIQAMFSALPYSLQNLLGIQKVSIEIGKATNMATEAWLTSIKSGKGQVRATASFLSTFGSSISAAIGPLGLLLAGVGLLAATIMGFENAVGDIAKDFGISRKRALELYDANNQLLTSYGNQLVSLEDINAVQKAHLDTYGRVMDVTIEANKSAIMFASNMANAFNIPIEDAHSLSGTLQKLGADQSLAQNLVANMGYMSEMAGISPNIISKDLLDSADELSLYFANQPKQAMKATIEIRRMGMSLKKAGEIATKMLDIEGFMTDMTELAAMTNGGLNLSEAFDLRMNGDIEGMTKSIMGEIGTLQNFNSQTEFVQRKLSNTLGMSVSELKNSVKLNEISNTLTKDQKALLESNLASMGDITGMNAEQLKQKAGELDNQKRITVAFEKLKGVLVAALLPLMESLSETITDLAPTMDVFVGVMKVAGKVLKFLMPIAQGFLIPFQMLGKLITWVSEKIEWVVNGISKLTGGSTVFNGTLDTMSTLLKGLGAIWGTYWLMNKTGAAGMLSGLLKSKDAIGSITESVVTAGKKTSLLGSLKDKFLGDSSALGKLFGKKLGGSATEEIQGTLTKKTSFLGKIFDKINPFKGPAATMVSTVESATAETGGLFDKLWDTISDKLNSFFDGSFKNGFKEVFSGISNTMKNLVTTAGKLITQLVQTIGGTISKLSNTILDIGKSVLSKLASIFTDTLPKLGSGIMKTMNSIINGISNGITSIIKFIGKGIETIGSSASKLIESVLTGLSNGLNKFTVKSLIGAASLVVVAGALFIAGKAIQEFIKIDWDSLAKAGVALLGLSGIAMLLGNIAPNVILGAAAMLILSASLVPMAYALKMFNDISWDTLAIAGVALLGLAGAVAGLGAIMMSGVGAVAIGLGTVALAAMGVAMLPVAFALKILSESVDKLGSANWAGISKGIPTMLSLGLAMAGLALLSPGIVLSSIAVSSFALSIVTLAAGINAAAAFKTTIVDPLKELNNVSSSNLIGLSVGLTALSASMLLFTGGNLVSSFIGLFSGNPFSSLTVLANQAEPIKVVADSIALLVSSLSELTSILDNLNVAKLSDMKNITLPDMSTFTKQMADNKLNIKSIIDSKTELIPANKLAQNKLSSPTSVTKNLENSVTSNKILTANTRNVFDSTNSSVLNSLSKNNTNNTDNTNNFDKKLLNVNQLTVRTDKIVPENNPYQPYVNKKYETQPLEQKPEIKVINTTPAIRPQEKVQPQPQKQAEPQPQFQYPDMKQDNTRLVMVMTQILNEIRNSNGRPINVTLDDGMLKNMNRKIKGFNNN